MKPFSAVLERLLFYAGLVALKANTRLVSWRVRRMGAKSLIHFPTKLYNPAFIAIGDRVTIREHVWLNTARASGTEPTLTIGDGSYIGRFCHINAREGVTLENDVLIADKVYISDYEHEFSDLTKPIIRQGLYARGPVRLKSGCWIGTGAVILTGVTVGKNAVVGANAVVNRDVPDFAIVAGQPAQIVKVRSPEVP